MSFRRPFSDATCTWQWSQSGLPAWWASLNECAPAALCPRCAASSGSSLQTFCSHRSWVEPAAEYRKKLAVAGILVNSRDRVSGPLPAQPVQSHQRPACRWCWSQLGWGWRKKHSQLHTCCAGKREKKKGKGLEMRRMMKEEIIHFQQPETKYLSVFELICLQILEDLPQSNLSRMLLRMWSV